MGDDYTIEQKPSDKKDDAPRIPYNDLEFAYLTLDPAWGKQVVDELRQRLQETKPEEAFEELDEKGQPTGKLNVPIEDLWGIHAMYTKDIRLGNLTSTECKEVVVWLNLAHDFLQLEYVKSFTCAMSRAISIIEVSQSRAGFVRRRANTFTKEDIKTERTEKIRRGIMGNKQETK